MKLSAKADSNNFFSVFSLVFSLKKNDLPRREGLYKPTAFAVCPTSFAFNFSTEAAVGGTGL